MASLEVLRGRAAAGKTPDALRKTVWGCLARRAALPKLKPVEAEASAPTQINVVLNWFEELRRKAPVTSDK